jgi:MYXO-CTERM domain-containing protein
MHLFLLLASLSPAADYTVGESGDFATITEAISAAAYGDTITVQPGTYAETIWLANGATIQAEQGLGSVVIDGSGATGNAAVVVNGTLRRLVFADAPGQAVVLQHANASMEQCTVLSPGSVGVAVTGGSPSVTEVAVHGAGTIAFSIGGDAPVIRRSIAVDPGEVGFSIAAPGTFTNLISFGGPRGFELHSQAQARHIAALDASASGLLTHSSAQVVDALFTDNALVAECGGHELELSYSLLYDSPESSDCPSPGFHDNLLAAPRMATWSPGARPPLVDLTPRGDSPLVDAGEGLDLDGSAADIGPFGGAAGVWTDRDGDGVPIHFDCDDSDERVHLYAAEREDGKDNDCDGEIDEADPVDTGPDTAPPEDTGDPGDTRDLDRDGWTVADGDCQDHNRATWPGAREIADGADNDCDGLIDEGLWYYDDDGDGVTELEGDCDDGDPSRSPNEPEQGEDGIDHDCDGLADGDPAADADGDGYTVGAGDCDDTNPWIHPGVFDGLDGMDVDCDGQTDEDALGWDGDDDRVTIGEMDCADDDISIYLGAAERADDGIDQDCDGIDLFDVDDDGHASPEAGGADCDDEDPAIHPGATERCDGLDNDCDGDTDELCSDSELDGPPRAPWDPGIRGACNCSSATGARPASPWWLWLGTAMLVRVRRRRRHDA